MDLSVVQTGPRSQGHSRRRGGKKRNTPNRSNNNKPTGKCFNCRKQGYWAKECRQPKREQGTPVQVNVLEAVERKLLPIPETEEHIPKTMIQDCVKTMKAEHRELENTEILQVIQNRIFALEGWFDLKVHQRAAVIGITNNLFVIYPDNLIERLLLQLDRDIPKGVALNLRALKVLLKEGYFNPEVMPERDTYTVKIHLARAIIQDLLDKQELESAEATDTDSTSSTSSDSSDWGILAELPMPPREHRDYVSWVRVRLADVDLYCTRTEAEQ
jgi:hypothetical protein